jgi:outer membrane biogenesis lipoprotein LolB
VALRERNWLRVGGALVLSLLMAACAGGRRHVPDTEPDGATMGVYRARVEDAEGQSRRFRLLLYATLPDRIHAEILSPVGTTEVIIDGGGGRVAVTVPRDRVVYVGPGDPEALEKVLGVRLSLADLVRGLLGHEVDSSGYEVDREPRGEVGLPEVLRIEGSGHRLTLRLKSRQPLRVSTATLGNGEPPAGMELRPLETLDSIDLPSEPHREDER